MPTGRPKLFPDNTKLIQIGMKLPAEDIATLRRAAGRRTNGNLSAYVRSIAAYIRKMEARGGK